LGRLFFEIENIGKRLISYFRVLENRAAPVIVGLFFF